MKSYTDIKQSKKLEEILPLESVDMRYEYSPMERDDIQEPIMGFSISSMNYYRDIDSIKYLPCWSLTALLNVLPQGTRLLKSAIDETYHCDCPKGNVNEWFDNSVDACYEIILKLHELNLL